MKADNNAMLVKDNKKILHSTNLSNVVPENLNFGTWIWYTVEDRLLFSKSFCQMAGISQDSFYDFRTFFDIVHGNDLLQFVNDIDAMLKGASPRWINFRIIRPDNTIQKVNCFLESMKSEFEEVFDISGVCFNINE